MIFKGFIFHLGCSEQLIGVKFIVELHKEKIFVGFDLETGFNVRFVLKGCFSSGI